VGQIEYNGEENASECVATGNLLQHQNALCEGEVVEVLLKMPEEVTGEETTEWRCTGHVVRVELSDATEGKLGVGVQFYCYEAVRPEQARLPLGTAWTSVFPS
jgi:hypothetical protein